MDEIHPMVSKLTGCLSRCQGLPPDFEGQLKLINWLKKLNTMRADSDISEGDARQLSLDIENAYNAFFLFISQEK